MHEEREPEPAQPAERIEAELPEPLLVDPAVSVRPHGQRVVGGQAVPYDLASGEECEPAVGHELALEADEHGDRAHGHDDDDEAVALEPSRGRRSPLAA